MPFVLIIEIQFDYAYLSVTQKKEITTKIQKPLKLIIAFEAMLKIFSQKKDRPTMKVASR